MVSSVPICEVSEHHVPALVTEIDVDVWKVSSTGVKEYNVHFAAAFIAAAPTLLVYILSGKYFVRGLMAGSVKG